MQPWPETFYCTQPVARWHSRWAGIRADFYRTMQILSGLAPHGSLELDEEKQLGMFEHFDHATFEISGYRTLSL